MGYITLVADCFGCGRQFTSNPDFVPSHDNRPICRNCVERVNREKRELGMPEFPIHPEAYDPLPEGQL